MDTNNLENNLDQDGQCKCKGNIEVLLCNRCCHGKAISVAFFECVSVVFVIQHANCMRCIMSSVASLAPPYFSTLSYNGTIFGKKIIEHEILF